MVQPALPLIPGPKPSKAKRVLVESEPDGHDREETTQAAINGETVHSEPPSDGKISLTENVHNGSSDNQDISSPAGQETFEQPFAY